MTMRFPSLGGTGSSGNIWNLKSGEDGRLWQGTYLEGTLNVPDRTVECYEHFPEFCMTCGTDG
jgi:hypothetical protein